MAQGAGNKAASGCCFGGESRTEEGDPLLPGDLKPAIHSVTGDKTDGTFGLQPWEGVAALTMYSMLEAGGYTWPRSLL